MYKKINNLLSIYKNNKLYITKYFTMGGSITENEFSIIKESNIKNFVETGTYKGDSSFLASKNYENVYTIEIHEKLFNDNIEKYKKNTNINFYFGDSIKLLDKILPIVSLEGSVFFIDAHISGSDSGWNEKQRVPLLEELDIILEYKLGPSIFIFNDIRFWKSKENEASDWKHISSKIILKRFSDKNISLSAFFEKNDRLYLYTK